MLQLFNFSSRHFFIFKNTSHYMHLKQISDLVKPALNCGSLTLGYDSKFLSSLFWFKWYALFPLFYIMYPVSMVSLILYPVSGILCPVFCIQCPVFCIQCPVSLILYPVCCFQWHAIFTVILISRIYYLIYKHKTNI